MRGCALLAGLIAFQPAVAADRVQLPEADFRILYTVSEMLSSALKDDAPEPIKATFMSCIYAKSGRDLVAEIKTDLAVAKIEATTDTIVKAVANICLHAPLIQPVK